MFYTNQICQYTLRYKNRYKSNRVLYMASYDCRLCGLEKSADTEQLMLAIKICQCMQKTVSQMPCEHWR